jgi:TFIIF-interacting CTD phosphatase-like protein
MSELEISLTMLIDTQKGDKSNTNQFCHSFLLEHHAELETMKWAGQQVIEPVEYYLLNYHQDSKVVIFDLDDTLVHTTEKGQVIIRPYAMELLESLSHRYELWLWSAADKAHINYVFSQHSSLARVFTRVFTRTYCIKLGDEAYLKFLGIFKNINLRNVVAIDDNMISYAKDVENYLFIDRYEGSNTDTELLEMETILECIFREDDARKSLQKLCNFRKYLNMLL